MQLTDATRPTFLEKLKGADLHSLVPVFGDPVRSIPAMMDITDYIIESWHGWGEITLRFRNDGLDALVASRYKNCRASAQEWREALWRDFGIACERIEIATAKHMDREIGEVEIASRLPGVARIVFRVSPGDVVAPSGSNLEAIKQEAVASSSVWIYFNESNQAGPLPETDFRRVHHLLR